jgi:hypothetical protein
MSQGDPRAVLRVTLCTTTLTGGSEIWRRRWALCTLLMPCRELGHWQLHWQLATGNWLCGRAALMSGCHVCTAASVALCSRLMPCYAAGHRCICGRAALMPCCQMGHCCICGSVQPTDAVLGSGAGIGAAAWWCSTDALPCAMHAAAPLGAVPTITAPHVLWRQPRATTCGKHSTWQCARACQEPCRVTASGPESW